MIGKEIRNILLNDTDVAAMVSTRVYSDLRPQTNNTVPAIVYRIQDKRREHTQDPAGVDFYRIEFAMYGETYSQIQELERRVENALDRYPIGTVINNYIIDGIIHEDSEDDPYDIDENGLRNKLAEYQCRIKVFNIVMNYSLTEADTGDTWVNAAAVYEKTWDLGAATGATDITGLTKTWSVLEWTLIEVRGTEIYIQDVSPTSDGATDWQIVLNASDTQSYFWARYIKETVA